MKLLIDHNLSPRIAHAVAALVDGDGHECVALRDKFHQATPDVTWISALGKEGGWSVLSGDHRIRKNAAEREAWRRTDLIGFFVAPSWLSHEPLHQAARLLMWWDKLAAQSGLVHGGAMFELPLKASSKLTQLRQ